MYVWIVWNSLRSQSNHFFSTKRHVPIHPENLTSFCIQIFYNFGQPTLPRFYCSILFKPILSFDKKRFKMLSTEDEWTTEEEIQVINETVWSWNVFDDAGSPFSAICPSTILNHYFPLFTAVSSVTRLKTRRHQQGKLNVVGALSLLMMINILALLHGLHCRPTKQNTEPQDQQRPNLEASEDDVQSKGSR